MGGRVDYQVIFGGTLVAMINQVNPGIKILIPELLKGPQVGMPLG
jgi:hypothetical protein